MNTRTQTSSGKVMTGFCLVTLVTLPWKYSLHEAKTEQWARKLLSSTATVTSHRTSCSRCSFKHCRTWVLCTADWKVNTDTRGAWSVMVLVSSPWGVQTASVSLWQVKVFTQLWVHTFFCYATGKVMEHVSMQKWWKTYLCFCCEQSVLQLLCN